MKEFSSSLIKAAIVAAIILFVLLGIFIILLCNSCFSRNFTISHTSTVTFYSSLRVS